MLARTIAASLALACAGVLPARAQDFAEFSSKGLARSEGLTVRIRHPADWKMVPSEDPMALAELHGPAGRVSGILQLARGQRGAQALCPPERAATMLQNFAGDEADTRVTEVFARTVAGRPGYEIRYERKHPPSFLQVRSLIVCLRDSRLLVSCGATAASKAALAEIDPVCGQVLESVRIAED
jgi:hypothetical protein